MKESVGVDLEGIIARRRHEDCHEEADSQATPTDNEEEEEETEQGDSDEAEEFSGIEDDIGIAFVFNVLHFS